LRISQDSVVFGEGLSQLELAIFAKQFVAFPALEGFVRELETDHALNFLNHFPLELVLDFIHFDVKRGHGLGAHHSLD
jgi:hypothetical protein